MRLAMPWFLPMASLIGWWGTRMALHLRHQGGKYRRGDVLFLMSLVWIPMLLWLATQLTRLGRTP